MRELVAEADGDGAGAEPLGLGLTATLGFLGQDDLAKRAGQARGGGLRTGFDVGFAADLGGDGEDTLVLDHRGVEMLFALVNLAQAIVEIEGEGGTLDGVATILCAEGDGLFDLADAFFAIASVEGGQARLGKLFGLRAGQGDAGGLAWGNGKRLLPAQKVQGVGAGIQGNGTGAGAEPGTLINLNLGTDGPLKLEKAAGLQRF